MKRITPLVAALALTTLPSCPMQKEGLVVLLDDSYDVSVLASSRSAGFGAPDGIFWHQGQLYLADEGGVAVGRWSKDRGLTVLCDRKAGILSPEDLVIDTNGNIWFTDDDAGGLWKIDPEGKTTLVAGKDQGLVSTEGIALMPGGNLLVGDGEKKTIYEVTPTGKVSVFLGPRTGIEQAESMVFDDQGRLYIADNRQNCVYRLDGNRPLEKVITPSDGVASPEGLAFARGVLYITDSKGNKLLQYTPTEGVQAIAACKGKLANLQGLTVDPEGNIYVTVQTDLTRQQGYILKFSRRRK